MKLSIIDTDKRVEYIVNWVELNTSVGNMVIQDKHAPTIVELAPNQELVFELDTGNIASIIVKQGVAHITQLEVKILIPLVV